MKHQPEFEIHYQFNAHPHCCLHQATQLCQSDALSCATLHAGVGAASGNISVGPIGVATLQAMRFGVTKVHWRRASLQA
ncbi:hypothetical protein EWW49_31865 [Pseudomonas syringae]|nr:hypothetical protein EWW49_31865 [Pseudomonas syringae]